MTGLTVRIIETLPEFLLLKEKWDALLEAMEFPHPNLAHAWTRCWWEKLGQGEAVYIMTVWEGGDLLAILPMKRQAIRFLKVFNFSCLHSIGDARLSAPSVICRASDLDRALSAIRDHLAAISRSWQTLVLPRVPLHAGIAQSAQRKLCCPDMRVFIEPTGRTFDTHFIEIKGDFDGYFNGLNKSFRHARRNNNNFLARKGRVDLEIVKSADPAALECFYDLEHKGWKGDAGTSILSSPEIRGFYDQIAAEFSKKGQFLLATLRVNGEAIASGFGLIFHNTFYFLKMGVNSFSAEYKNVSPGQALTFHLLKFCFTEKISVFDFYGPCYPYQAHWTKAVRRRKTVLVFNTRHPLVKVCASLKGMINFVRTWRVDRREKGVESRGWSVKRREWSVEKRDEHRDWSLERREAG